MLSVRVLGCSGTYAAPGGACSGYLVQSPTTNVWLDAGPGSLGNIQRYAKLSEVDAVVLSHCHPDHWLELPVVANAIKWHQNRSPVSVYANRMTIDEARRLIGPSTASVFEWHEIAHVDRVAIGDQSWFFHETEHYVPTLASLVTSGEGCLYYSADTGIGIDVEPVIVPQGNSLGLIESSYLNRQDRLHLSAVEAGELATRLGLNRLLLTHHVPFESALDHVRAASTTFAGPIESAVVGGLYHSGRSLGVVE